MSPLIDMMFLLLIFFIVTTAFVEEVGIEIQKPKAASSQNLEKKSILIGVSKDGKVVYGDKEIGLNRVRGLVSKLLKDQECPVIIIADDSCRSGILVDVIDECKLAGAKKVSIATEKE
ncbi:MAG: biopolymer transporter ExbD [Candidatus Omnitrophica bacterium]|nr:biopolymer transporter ExbD [Candidatus Omnitrophota bacterium]